MKPWKKAIQDGLVSGAIAAAVSAIALAARGKFESNSLFGPVNAISHWIWGDEAAQHDDASARYSLLGYAIHNSAATMWATIYERWFGQYAEKHLDKHSDTPVEKREIAKAITAGMAVSAAACFVDYKMTPHRLQPGYEMRLSKQSLFFVYAAFGLGMVLRGMVAQPAPDTARAE
jgi:hypothetical protein